MKILILGGGICGLSTYLALKQRLPGATINLYESHTSTTLGIGGGLGLAPNGLRALHSLDTKIPESIAARGFGCDRILFRNAAGRKLGTMISGTKERYGFEQQFLARSEVYAAVLERVEDKSGIVWGRKVQAVKEDGKRVVVTFEDGTTEEAHLVLGCDGVRSVTRQAVVNGAEAEYQGLTGTGGFLSTASLPQKLQDALKTEAVTMTFGPDGFFGYSLCNADGSQVQWWSTFEAASPLPRDMPVSEIRESLLRRHGEWKSPHDTSEHPVFSSIIKQACGSSDSATAAEQGVLVLPVYVISRLSTWGSESGRILLLGDAAHTMPPDTGQGVSCAAEDAIAIAMLLENAGENVDFRKLKEDYETLRMPRIHKILDIAKRMGDQKKKLSAVQELMRDVAMWVMCKLPEGTVSERFAYDVQMEVEKLLEKRKVRPS